MADLQHPPLGVLPLLHFHPKAAKLHSPGGVIQVYTFSRGAESNRVKIERERERERAFLSYWLTGMCVCVFSFKKPEVPAEFVPVALSWRLLQVQLRQMQRQNAALRLGDHTSSMVLIQYITVSSLLKVLIYHLEEL